MGTTTVNGAATRGILDQFGRPAADPWQPPRDPLRGVDVRSAARIISREIPLSVVQSSWGVGDVREALDALVHGRFDLPAQLADAIIGDDRVQSAFGQRVGGLFGRPVKFTASQHPKWRGTRQAQRCLDAWQEVWPTIAAESTLEEIQCWALMMFGLGQILWDTSEDVWVPHLRTFHPRYTYYDQNRRQLMAVTLDGIVPVTPGDGHWFLHAPHGEHRGWMKGTLRALAQPWLIRNLAYRDWARWSERHGLPIFLAKTPAGGDPALIERFRSDLAALGQESIVQLPQGVEQQFSYDLDYLEATDTAWEGFAQIIDRAESSITLAVLFQNLTTQIEGAGSLAAARQHADTRQAALETDERRLFGHTIYQQLARAFAAINFGDPDLAVSTRIDMSPPEDHKAAAETFGLVATSIAQLKTAGFEVGDIVQLGKRFGLQLDSAALARVASVEPKEAA